MISLGSCCERHVPVFSALPNRINLTLVDFQNHNMVCINLILDRQMIFLTAQVTFKLVCYTQRS